MQTLTSLFDCSVFPRFDVQKSTCRVRRTLISKAFYKSSKGRKLKYRATKRIIESVLDIDSHKQQCLALINVLVYSILVNQATDCGYV